MTEPIAFFDPQGKGFYWAKPTKISAPVTVDIEPLALYEQSTWVGLTDKEIEAIWKIAMFTDYGIGAELSNQPFVHYARAIEAKLKDKNNVL